MFAAPRQSDVESNNVSTREGSFRNDKTMKPEGICLVQKSHTTLHISGTEDQIQADDDDDRVSMSMPTVKASTKDFSRSHTLASKGMQTGAGKRNYNKARAKLTCADWGQFAKNSADLNTFAREHHLSERGNGEMQLPMPALHGSLLQVNLNSLQQIEKNDVCKGNITNKGQGKTLKGILDNNEGKCQFKVNGTKEKNTIAASNQFLHNKQDQKNFDADQIKMGKNETITNIAECIKSEANCLNYGEFRHPEFPTTCTEHVYKNVISELTNPAAAQGETSQANSDLKLFESIQANAVPALREYIQANSFFPPYQVCSTIQVSSSVLPRESIQASRSSESLYVNPMPASSEFSRGVPAFSACESVHESIVLMPFNTTQRSPSLVPHVSCQTSSKHATNEPISSNSYFVTSECIKTCHALASRNSVHISHAPGSESTQFHSTLAPIASFKVNSDFSQSKSLETSTAFRKLQPVCNEGQASQQRSTSKPIMSDNMIAYTRATILDKHHDSSYGQVQYTRPDITDYNKVQISVKELMTNNTYDKSILKANPSEIPRAFIKMSLKDILQIKGCIHNSAIEATELSALSNDLINNISMLLHDHDKNTNNIFVKTDKVCGLSEMSENNVSISSSKINMHDDSKSVGKMTENHQIGKHMAGFNLPAPTLTNVSTKSNPADDLLQEILMRHEHKKIFEGRTCDGKTVTGQVINRHSFPSNHQDYPYHKSPLAFNGQQNYQNKPEISYTSLKEQCIQPPGFQNGSEISHTLLKEQCIQLPVYQNRPEMSTLLKEECIQPPVYQNRPEISYTLLKEQCIQPPVYQNGPEISYTSLKEQYIQSPIYQNRPEISYTSLSYTSLNQQRFQPPVYQNRPEISYTSLREQCIQPPVYQNRPEISYTSLKEQCIQPPVYQNRPEIKEQCIQPPIYQNRPEISYTSLKEQCIQSHVYQNRPEISYTTLKEQCIQPPVYQNRPEISYTSLKKQCIQSPVNQNRPEISYTSLKQQHIQPSVYNEYSRSSPIPLQSHVSAAEQKLGPKFIPQNEAPQHVKSQGPQNLPLEMRPMERTFSDKKLSSGAGPFGMNHFETVGEKLWWDGMSSDIMSQHTGIWYHKPNMWSIAPDVIGDAKRIMQKPVFLSRPRLIEKRNDSYSPMYDRHHAPSVVRQQSSAGGNSDISNLVKGIHHFKTNIMIIQQRLQTNPHEWQALLLLDSNQRQLREYEQSLSSKMLK